MSMTSRSALENSQTYRSPWFRAMLSAGVVWLAATCPTQAQQGASLADAARQARAQKAEQPRAEPSQAQQVADQLAEDQDDSGNAPAGFKTYNAGDYRVWVPAPFRVEGHDDSGVVLANSQQGRTRTFVLVGNPVVLSAAGGDDAFRDLATQFAHVYAQSATCTQTTIADRKAYQCGLAAASLLGRTVSGNAVFVRGSRGIIPVFCVAPTASRARDIYNNPRSTYAQKRYAREAMDREDQDVKSTWQACDSVLQSVRLKGDGEVKASTAKTEHIAGAPAKAASGVQAVADPANNAPASFPSRAEAGNTGGAPSLADIARQLHEGGAAPAVIAQPQPESAAESNAVPEGLKTHSFTYCQSHSRQCWDATVFVPAEAKLVSSGCKQYVFEMKVNGQPFLLLAGQSGMESCQDHAAGSPDPVRWHQLVDPENMRAVGTASTISNLQMTLAGKPANITKLKFKRGTADWMAKRADVDSNGIQLAVGCMAPRDTFADGEAICSALIESLRLP